MFSQNDIQLYKSIQAPDVIREKMLQKAAQEKPKKKPHRVWAAAAAAACIALAAATFYPTAPSVEYLGKPIGISPVAVSGEAAQYGIRTVSLQPTVIELEIAEDTEISASHGSLERGESGRVYWILTPDVTEATLAVANNRKTTQYFLRADATGVWYMEKK